MFPSKRYPAVAAEEFNPKQVLAGKAKHSEEQSQISVRRFDNINGPNFTHSSSEIPLPIESMRYIKLKRAFDIAACCCLLPLAAVLLALLSAVVLLSAGFPIFYRQERVGQNGKPFTLYKFRTMRTDGAEHLSEWFVENQDALQEWTTNQKLKYDPRITGGGRFLRKTSLDELPQLLNVLRGEMTLVGPRPIVTAELARYGNRVHFYLAAVPGLTGLWQVSGRCNVSYEQRVDMDEDYVRRWSFGRDLKILLRTPLSVLRGDGAC